jgi:hypothetical protein
MMAALIMLTNILADYADNGVVGLPKAILDNNKTVSSLTNLIYFNDQI